MNKTEKAKKPTKVSKVTKTTEAKKKTSDAKKKTSDAKKKTSDAKKKTSDAKKKTSVAKPKNTIKTEVQEELNPILADEREVFIKNTMKGFQMTRKEVYSHMATDKNFIKKYGIFIIEVGYSNREDARNLMTDEMEKLKFHNVDSCGERAGFDAKPGKWRNFEQKTKEIAKKYNIKLKRVIYILDSGLGMIYKYPEDLEMFDLPTKDKKNYYRNVYELN